MSGRQDVGFVDPELDPEVASSLQVLFTIPILCQFSRRIPASIAAHSLHRVLQRSQN
jgi:hypothetical protein